MVYVYVSLGQNYQWTAIFLGVLSSRTRVTRGGPSELRV